MIQRYSVKVKKRIKIDNTETQVKSLVLCAKGCKFLNDESGKTSVQTHLVCENLKQKNRLHMAGNHIEITFQ